MCGQLVLLLIERRGSLSSGLCHSSQAVAAWRAFLPFAVPALMEPVRSAGTHYNSPRYSGLLHSYSTKLWYLELCFGTIIIGNVLSPTYLE